MHKQIRMYIYHELTKILNERQMRYVDEIRNENEQLRDALMTVNDLLGDDQSLFSSDDFRQTTVKIAKTLGDVSK